MNSNTCISREKKRILIHGIMPINRCYGRLYQVINIKCAWLCYGRGVNRNLMQMFNRSNSCLVHIKLSTYTVLHIIELTQFPAIFRFRSNEIMS